MCCKNFLKDSRYLAQFIFDTKSRQFLCKIIKINLLQVISRIHIVILLFSVPTLISFCFCLLISNFCERIQHLELMFTQSEIRDFANKLPFALVRYTVLVLLGSRYVHLYIYYTVNFFSIICISEIRLSRDR